MCLSSFVIAFKVLSIAVYASELASCIACSSTFLCNYLSCVLVMFVWMHGFYFSCTVVYADLLASKVNLDKEFFNILPGEIKEMMEMMKMMTIF